VFLYDIDDLEHIVDENLSERQKAAEKIDQMIQTEIDTFNEWVQTLGVVPVISALRKKALSIQATTMKSIERKIPDLTEREKKVLNKHTKSIINQLLKNPIMQAKEIAGMEDREQALAQFIDIFGIDDEVQEEFVKQANKDKTLKQLNTSKRVSFPMDVILQKGERIPNMVETKWVYEIILLIYSVSLVGYFIDFIQQNRKANKLAFWLLTVVWFMQTVFLWIQIFTENSFPIRTVTDSLFFYSWILVTFSLLIHWLFNVHMIMFFINTFNFFILLLHILTKAQETMDLSSIQLVHEILIAHIVLTMISYGFFTLSFLFSL